MKFGPNSEAVEEVLAFARTGPLLSGDRGAATGVQDILRVDDIEAARTLAWEAVYGADELNWNDIRSRQMRPVVAATYRLRWYEEARPAFDGLLKDLTRVIEQRLGPGYRDLVDDVVADLYNIAKARAVLAGPSAFLERLWLIYGVGAWPCGWDGDYPEGRIAVFLPNSR